MFYLIICDADKSICTVEDFEMIYDVDQPPAIDDHVQFFWGKDKYSGTIVNLSENADELKEVAKKLKSKRKLLVNSPNKSTLPEKRSRKPKKSWSFTEDPENLELEKPKKDPCNSKKTDDNKSKGLQKQVKTVILKNKNDKQKNKSVPVTDINSKKSPTKKELKLMSKSEKSPTKEELKLMVEQQQKLLASFQGSTSKENKKPLPMNSKGCIISDDDGDDGSNHESSDESDDVHVESIETDKDKDRSKIALSSPEAEEVDTKESENSNPQLYGKDCGESTIELKHGIYCKRKTYDDAVDLSRKSATSFLRRLMDGVFKREEIFKCTCTGRPPSAQGKERQSERVNALDRVARNAIIEFSDEYATKQGWSKPTKGQLRGAMSQWIGELKRTEKENRDRHT